MNKPTNISTLRFAVPKRKLTVHHLLWVVMFIGFCVGVYRVADDSMDAIYLDGMSEGNEIAQRDFKGVIKREMFKAEKVQMCLGYYFNDDPERVAKSIQTVCKVSK